jgi:hypothetical protein
MVSIRTQSASPPGEVAHTALDAVYDAYKEIDEDEDEEEKALDELDLLLRKHRGKKHHELPARLRFSRDDSDTWQE